MMEFVNGKDDIHLLIMEKNVHVWNHHSVAYLTDWLNAGLTEEGMDEYMDWIWLNDSVTEHWISG